MAVIFKIKRLMREQNMSLEELTELLGKTSAGASLLSNGHVACLKIEAIDKLCEIFNCPISDIIEHIPEPVNKVTRRTPFVPKVKRN